MTFPVTSAKVLSLGDILAMTSGTGTVADANTNALVSTVVGICAEAKASVATAGINDVVLCHLALPGVLFLGNMVGGAATDYGTPAQADLTWVAASPHDTVELTTEAFPAVNQADVTVSTSYVRCFAFAREQAKGANIALAASSPVNPRVIFNFATTVFNINA
jgi:hypothetical protein